MSCRGMCLSFGVAVLRAAERGACNQSEGGSLRFEQHPKAPLTPLCHRSPSPTLPVERWLGGGEESRPISTQCAQPPVSGGASWEEILPECAPTPTHENLTPGYPTIPTGPTHSRCPINKTPKLLAAWTMTLTDLLVPPGARSRISSSGSQGSPHGAGWTPRCECRWLPGLQSHLHTDSGCLLWGVAD